MTKVVCRHPKHRGHQRTLVTPRGKVICDCGEQLNLFEDNVVAVEVMVTPEGLKILDALWNKVDLKTLLLAIKQAEEKGEFREVVTAIKLRLSELVRERQTA